MLQATKIKTVCRDGVCKVSASCQSQKVTLLVRFCYPSLPHLTFSLPLCLWCCLRTPQSPKNLRSLVKAVRVRCSPAKCKSMRKDVHGEDQNAEPQQPAGMEQVCGLEQSDLMALRETWKYQVPCSPSR